MLRSNQNLILKSILRPQAIRFIEITNINTSRRTQYMHGSTITYTKQAQKDASTKRCKGFHSSNHIIIVTRGSYTRLEMDIKEEEEELIEDSFE